MTPVLPFIALSNQKKKYNNKKKAYKNARKYEKGNVLTENVKRAPANAIDRVADPQKLIQKNIIYIANN